MELTINGRNFSVTFAKINEISTLHEFGEVYHCAVKTMNEITGEMDFYYECYELTAKLKKFRAKDTDSFKALLQVLRYFCYNNQSTIIESDDLNETNGKREFEKFAESLDDDNLNVCKSDAIGCQIYLFDEEDSFDNINTSIIEKRYKQNDLEFNIKEFN